MHIVSFKGQPVKLSGGTYAMGMGHVTRVSTVVLYILLGSLHNTCFLHLSAFMYITGLYLGVCGKREFKVTIYIHQ